jgi:hypothetical protein
MRFGVGPGTYDHRHLTQLIFTMHGVAWCSGIGDVAECNTNWFCQQAGDENKVLFRAPAAPVPKFPDLNSSD